ncbi:MAG: ParA family protein [Micrococcales bacterium]
MANKNADTRFPVPKQLSGVGPARIIAFCNQKGGVGKTTSAINIAAAMAEYGRKVLIVDFDPQGAASAGLGVYSIDGHTVYDLLMDKNLNIHEVIKPTSTKNLDIIPANIELAAAEVRLVNEVSREKILARVLKPVLDEYDLILIDCQPSLGLLTVNALAAAHGVLIPLACDFFALRGVAILMEIIDKVIESDLNPTLQVDGILATMFDSTLHSREVLDRLYDAFGDKVFRSIIHRTVKFRDSTSAASPITEFAPGSEAAESYKTVARELVHRGYAP